MIHPMWIIVISISILIVVYLNCFSPWSRQQRKYWDMVKRTRNSFAERSEHTPQEFAHVFFSEGQQETAKSIAEILSKLRFLEKDIISHMIPSDRLIEDLGIGVYDGLEMNEFVKAIQERFGIIIDESAEEVITVGQLVEYIDQKIRIG